MKELLKLAHEICTTAHEGQVDKAGMPYHLHPERVAARCSTDAESIVALLHDTIEDTDITPEYLLSRGFPQYIIDGIISVTKREGESYENFVSRAKQNPIGRMVKIHDLEDNMDIRRLNEIDDATVERLRKYLKAYIFLTQTI
ncbi:MAG: GTP pyrophosphokinase [Muribaculaceae bacterium]|nr:GTP pyrophosphokinase [Muribaculaceae bacterium]